MRLHNALERCEASFWTHVLLGAFVGACIYDTNVWLDFQCLEAMSRNLIAP